MSEKYARQPRRESPAYLTVSMCCAVPVSTLLAPPSSHDPFACLIAPTQSNRGNFIRHLRWKLKKSRANWANSTRNLQTEFTRGPQIISNTVAGALASWAWHGERCTRAHKLPSYLAGKIHYWREFAIEPGTNTAKRVSSAPYLLCLSLPFSASLSSVRYLINNAQYTLAHLVN